QWGPQSTSTAKWLKPGTPPPDVVTSYVLGPDFSLKDLRCHKNRAKPFFDMTRADSPSSVFALEDNFGFVLTLAVTYAPDGCFPPHSHFKEVFVDMADTYGIFPERTMRRVVKDITIDWAHYTGGQARAMGIHALNLAGRSEKVALLKKAIHMALVEGAAPHEAGRDPVDLAKQRFEKVLRQDMAKGNNLEKPEAIEVTKAEPDAGDKKDTQAIPNLPKAQPNVENKKKELATPSLPEAGDTLIRCSKAPDVTADKVDGCLGNRQEKHPLLPSPIVTTPGLPDQAAVLTEKLAAVKDGGDLLAAQNKVMKAVLRGSKRPSEEGQAEPQENENGEPLKVKKPRGAAKAAAAKAAGKPATAVKAAAKKRNKPTGHGEASAASPADHGEVSAASPSDAKPDEDGGGDDGTKPLTVKEQWDLKEPKLKAVGIPIPDSAGSKQWAVDQLYVNAAKGKLSPGIKHNAKGNGMISSIEALRMISLQLQDFLLLFEIASGFGRVAFCGVGYPVPRQAFVHLGNICAARFAMLAALALSVGAHFCVLDCQFIPTTGQEALRFPNQLHTHDASRTGHVMDQYHIVKLLQTIALKRVFKLDLAMPVPPDTSPEVNEVIEDSPVVELDLMLTSDAYPYREEHGPVDDISRLPTLELSPSVNADLDGSPLEPTPEPGPVEPPVARATPVVHVEQPVLPPTTVVTPGPFVDVSAGGDIPIATPSREVMKQYWSKFKKAKDETMKSHVTPNAAMASVVAPGSAPAMVTQPHDVVVASPATARPVEPAVVIPPHDMVVASPATERPVHPAVVTPSREVPAPDVVMSPPDLVVASPATSRPVEPAVVTQPHDMVVASPATARPVEPAVVTQPHDMVVASPATARPVEPAVVTLPHDMVVASPATARPVEPAVVTQPHDMVVASPATARPVEPAVVTQPHDVVVASPATARPVEPAVVTLPHDMVVASPATARPVEPAVVTQPHDVVVASPATARPVEPAVVTPSPEVPAPDVVMSPTDMVAAPPATPLVVTPSTPATPVEHHVARESTAAIKAALTRATTVDLTGQVAPANADAQADAAAVKAAEVMSSGCGNKFEWDKLYDMFLECKGDWLKSTLVLESLNTHAHERAGKWKTFSKKDLMEKYGDEIAVLDLIARKTADNMYESDLNFPDKEMRTYWCWDHNEEVDKNTRSNTVGTRSAGDLDTRTAGQSPLEWQDRLDICERVGLGVLEWPTSMVDALVQDMDKYLSPIESGRGVLEGFIATGSTDDDKIRLETQKLNNTILDYQKAAAHAKRHTTKPKAKSSGGRNKPAVEAAVQSQICCSLPKTFPLRTISLEVLEGEPRVFWAYKNLRLPWSRNAKEPYNVEIRIKDRRHSVDAFRTMMPGASRWVAIVYYDIAAFPQIPRLNMVQFFSDALFCNTYKALNTHHFREGLTLEIRMCMRWMLRIAHPHV
ncbi:unnamed protein product, partial [Cladocopium goreaui]